MSSAPGGSSSGHAAAAASAPLDVAALLTAARGAPPLICALAAQSVHGNNWGNWNDAPATPLSAVAPSSTRDFTRDNGASQLAPADVNRLLDALASSDPCVRELSVRVLGGQRSENVASGLIERLGASDASLREVAALGLGMVQPWARSMESRCYAHLEFSPRQR